VIVKVNNEAISDTGDFSHTLRSGKENAVSIGIIRDKKEQTLSLTLPERKQSGLKQESFDLPDMNAETEADMDEMKVEMAEMQPKIQQQIQQYAEEMKRVQPEIEKASKEAVEQQMEVQKEWQEDMKDMQEDIREQQQGIIDQQKDYQELLQHPHLSGGADI
jgi:hypothetical protein